MLVLKSSFLLIQCMLVVLINAQCVREAKQCLKCPRGTSAKCTLSADNKRLQCSASPFAILRCSARTCDSEHYTCMSSWHLNNNTNAWEFLSDCVSTGTSDPCDSGDTCRHQFDPSDPLPDSLASGSYFCQCYRNSCNLNFLADATPPVINPSESSRSGISTSRETKDLSTTIAATPTVLPFNESNCIACKNVVPNCTVSEDKRSLECFIDNECVNNITHCPASHYCSATLVRQSVSSPWIATTDCVGGNLGDQPSCKPALPVPVLDNVETGFYICSCLGGSCRKRFGIDLNASTSTMSSNSSTTSSSIPNTLTVTTTTTPSSATNDVVNSTSSTSTRTANMTTTPISAANVNTDGLSGNEIIAISVSLTVVFCLIIFAVLITGFCIYAHRDCHKVGHTEWDPTEDALRETLSQLPLEPMEIVGNGRFGTVWKAKLHEEMVACKILSFKEAKSWENERMLYCLPSTPHPNILEYIGSEQKGQGYEAQYLMVLQYCPLGSLSSYLKGHTLSWNQACNFINSALSGVAHLHAESYYDAEGVCQQKYPIAHRDIKSTNFLVKSDSGECVLSDLGLSLQLKPNMDISELASIGQVGTYRYMSPEALDASVSLQDPESFKQIDMYALALVLWEIASRCPANDGDTVPEYSLPFSREVGERANPTLDAMRTIVVHGRKRPKIPETWKTHEGLSVLADTLPECWDQDPEARLTASGVLGRMEEMVEIKGHNRQKIKLLRSQAESTSSCESGTISSLSSKVCSSGEATAEANERASDFKANNTSTSEEITVEASEIDNGNAVSAEEVTVDASEVH